MKQEAAEVPHVRHGLNLRPSGRGARQGKNQTVQVNAKRKLGPIFLNYQVNNGRTRVKTTKEWRGGERYGKGYDRYYHRMRGQITGTKPGDTVKVWFSSLGKKSGSFTYKVHDDIGGKVLVLAAEDVTGLTPAQEGTEAKYAGAYAQALQAAGYSSDVYDMDKMGRKAPHPLGVLSHYKAVIWETGDDIIPRARCSRRARASPPRTPSTWGSARRA